MKRILIFAVILFSSLQSAVAEPITFYNDLTDIEITEFGERIWFWTPDTVWGPLRSNDFLYIKYSPTFFDHVITTGDRFLYQNQYHEPYFEIPPTFNSSPYRFPQNLTYLRDLARVRIDDNGGTLLTTLIFEYNNVLVYQQPLGGIGDDSLIRRIGFEDFRMFRKIIFVDGEVDVKGVVSGLWTVYATGNIGLIDNFIYSEADRRTGRFNPDRTWSMAALVSEKNIVVRNTVVNGRSGGYEAAPDDWDRHSVAINGSLIALNQSFTFEERNEEYDRYQGPTPDERGSIYFTGGIAQKRRGYVHRSNHIWTGYGRQYHYDERLRHETPPGFAPNETPDLSGYYDEIEHLYRGTYSLTDVTTNRVDVYAGVTLNLSSGDALTVRQSFYAVGSERFPVKINCTNGAATITVTGSATVDMKWVELGPGVEVVFGGESFLARNCSFGGGLSAEGNVVIYSCRFEDAVNLSGFGDYSVEYSIFRGGLNLNGGRSDGLIESCSIVGSRSGGVRLRGRAQPTMTNCIIAFNRYGVQNDTRYDQEIRYSDVFGNLEDDFVDMEAGEGCISSDPLFANQAGGDYQLDWVSPCIDAGDPTSPPDPDGSRADMGACYFDHVLSAPEKEFGMGKLEIGIAAAPNPLNDKTILRYEIPSAGDVKIAVYDLNGRLQEEVMNQHVEAGSLRLALDASGWPAGVYLVTLRAGNEFRSVKVVKLN